MCIYNNVLRLSVLLLLTCCYTVAVAQKIVKVRGEYVYRGPENISLTEARRIALERAKIQALADEFGTVVSRTNATTVTNREGRSSVDFMTIGASEVRGEWIETIGEPVYTEPFYEQGMLVFKVEVEGRAREIKGAGVDCEVRLLRNQIKARERTRNIAKDVKRKKRQTTDRSNLANRVAAEPAEKSHQDVHERTPNSSSTDLAG